MKKLLLTLLVALSFVSCSKEKTTGPKQPHFDRDMCERCKMVVSDRHHTVQTIDPKTKKVYFFDDLGCMVLWFEENKKEWKNKAPIWITDAKTGEWIDARKAYYDSGNITPMAFGFMAHKRKEDIDPKKKIYTYEEVRKEILSH